jgi:hypothetical protein
MHFNPLDETWFERIACFTMCAALIWSYLCYKADAAVEAQIKFRLWLMLVVPLLLFFWFVCDVISAVTR